MGEARFEFLFNHGKLLPKEFRHKAIEKYSKLESRQFSGKDTSFAMVTVSIDTVEDETDYVHWGRSYD